MTKYSPDIEAALEQYVGSGDGSGDSMAFGKNAYEGAEMWGDRSISTWAPTLQSADGDLLPEKPILDARARDIARNDALIQSGIALHKNSIVGSMFLLNLKPEMKVLGIDDEKWEEEFQEEVEAKFMTGAESVNCWLDAARTMTFTDIIRLGIGVVAASGEMLASVEWIKNPTRPFSTAIQMIDIDRLRTPMDRVTDTDVRGGVRVDRYGAPLGYYITDTMTAGLLNSRLNYESRYIPAYKWWGRQQMIHIREQIRPHQTRGFSEMVAGLKETKMAKKFRDSTLQQAIAAALFAMSIESELPSDAVFASLGAGNLKPGPAITAYGAAYLAAVEQYAGSAKNMHVDGMKIPHFFPGTRLNIKNVGAPGGVGQDFETSLNRYCAALLGVSYEEYSRDYSKTNYSSMKGGMNNTRKYMEARKKLVADRLATIIFMVWFEEMIGRNAIESMKYSKLPNFYDPLMKEAYCSADWIGAGMGQIDELKETQAAILRIKGGLSTWEIELGRLGRDWRKVMRQKAREQALMQQLGITMEEDNSINAASGSPRENNEGDERDAA